MNFATSTLDIGKLRGLQRIVSPDGFIETCALDHLADLTRLMSDDYLSVPQADVVAVKQEIVATLAPSSSSLLLDAQYGLQAVAAGALPGNVGLMLTLEDQDYDLVSPLGGRTSVFRPGWTIKQIKMAGGDAAKFLWMHRADRNPATAEHQLDVMRSVVEDCREQSIGLVVEPIWYPFADEDQNSTEYRARRARGIVDLAIETESLGADVLKVEFPGHLDSENDRRAAIAACSELGSSVQVPWVILSAGVSHEVFKAQLQIACEAGASGYLAGRSVWGDAVRAKEPVAHARALEGARHRQEELNAITTKYGEPYQPWVPLAEAVEQMPETWYLDWHSAT
jgi:tagatose 1,6-diphosphate aldolase